MTHTQSSPQTRRRDGLPEKPSKHLPGKPPTRRKPPLPSCVRLKAVELNADPPERQAEPMIEYKHGTWGMAVLARRRGSVIPKARDPEILLGEMTRDGASAPRHPWDFLGQKRQRAWGLDECQLVQLSCPKGCSFSVGQSLQRLAMSCSSILP